MIKFAEERFGKIDILVNNAGIYNGRCADGQNCGGVIVNISSGAGLTGAL